MKKNLFKQSCLSEDIDKFRFLGIHRHTFNLFGEVRNRGPSLYEVLELSPNATLDEIRRNYRRLAFKYHPDKNPNDPEAAEKFKRINKAHTVLSDPKKRDLYNEYGDVGIAVGSKVGDEKARETCKKLKTNPCCMCLCGLISFLTCCYCCLCCCFCCCCCGQLELDDGDEPCDLNELGELKEDDEKDVVTSQPKTDNKQSSNL